jgi:hypothetical protein
VAEQVPEAKAAQLLSALTQLQAAAQAEYGIVQHQDVQAAQVEAAAQVQQTAVVLEYRAVLALLDKVFQADQVYVLMMTALIATMAVVVVEQVAQG